jgi:hypothetical protein
VAMLEKLALLKIARCKAPAFSSVLSALLDVRWAGCVMLRPVRIAPEPPAQRIALRAGGLRPLF